MSILKGLDVGKDLIAFLTWGNETKPFAVLPARYFPFNTHIEFKEINLISEGYGDLRYSQFSYNGLHLSEVLRNDLLLNRFMKMTTRILIM
jgi:hypothetical protein